MAKPSIFSRDYEKKMRRRKRRIILAVLLVLVLGVAVFIKFQLPNINFTEIKGKIQAWVDTGKVEEPDTEQIEEPEEDPQEIIEPEKTYLDIQLKEDVLAKVEYVEQEGIKKFVALEPIEGYTFVLSPNQEQIIIMDNLQNLYLCKNDGTFNDITKKEYVSTAGKAYSKDTMIAQYEGYVWNSLPGFIDENTIVFTSQLPYFGAAATHKYIWVMDIATGTNKQIWTTKGLEIEIGAPVPDKGIALKIDGIDRIMNINGEFVE